MKWGLKLWSDNDYYIECAKELYEKGYFDYLELYIIPDSYKGYLKLWENFKVQYIVHAPHYLHGFNLADHTKSEYNYRLFNETRLFADRLNAPYIIVHAGILGNQSTVKENLIMFNDRRILVENKPFKSINLELCAGTSPDEIRAYKESSKVGFCFDVGHAVNYALSTKKDYLEAIKDFLELNPTVIHIGGIDCNSEIDKHIHLKQSNCDIDKILRAIKKSKTEFWSLETPKNSKKNLDDFKEDISFLRSLLNNCNA